jgi:hypothetical protein
MSRLQIIVIAAILLVPPTGIILYSTISMYLSDASDSNSKSFQKLRWDDLRQLDYKTGNAPATLTALNGKDVMIPGFVVPLEDEDTQLSEFLLVPSPQACIHVPPPPANQMVLVKMDPEKSPKRSWGAVWIKGRLQISNSETQYGTIAFKMYGAEAEIYQDN